MTHAERMARFDETDLYVVITESYCAGRSSLEVLDAVLDAGVRLIQLREKDLETLAHYRLAEQYRAKTADVGALLIIDDRVDIALAVDADGVHLGEYDLPVQAARRIAPDLILGASSHNLDEALAAADAGASYVNIGPIFATRTKTLPMEPLGLDAIVEIAPHLRIPFTNMGGIKEHNIHQIVEHGGRHPAVVTAVTEADDPRAAALALREAMGATV